MKIRLLHNSMNHRAQVTSTRNVAASIGRVIFEILITGACAGALMLGCRHATSRGFSGRDQRWSRALADIQKRNAREEVAIAIEKKDYRFMAIMEYSVRLPGLEQEQDRLISKYGVQVIRGTTDAIGSDEQARFQAAATNYAYDYNRLLYAYLQRH